MAARVLCFSSHVLKKAGISVDWDEGSREWRIADTTSEPNEVIGLMPSFQDAVAFARGLALQILSPPKR